MPAIKVINLSKTYRVGRQAVPAVHGVTLEVPDGKIVTLLGPSGCGKSTTLRCIAGLERADDGEIFFDIQKDLGMRERIEKQRKILKEKDRKEQERERRPEGRRGPPTDVTATAAVPPGID